MRYYVEIFLDKSREILVQDTNMALPSASQSRSHLRELTRSEFVVLLQQMKVEIQTNSGNKWLEVHILRTSKRLLTYFLIICKYTSFNIQIKRITFVVGLNLER